MKEIKKESPKAFYIGITLLTAGVSWSFVMTQHFLVHLFTTRNIGMFYGFVAGYGCYAYIGLLKKHFKERKPLYMTAHVIFIGYTAVMFFSQQFFDLYIRYGFAYPFFGK
jgi:hypothetical protein